MGCLIGVLVAVFLVFTNLKATGAGSGKFGAFVNVAGLQNVRAPLCWHLPGALVGGNVTMNGRTDGGFVKLHGGSASTKSGGIIEIESGTASSAWSSGAGGVDVLISSGAPGAFRPGSIEVVSGSDNKDPGESSSATSSALVLRSGKGGPSAGSGSILILSAEVSHEQLVGDARGIVGGIRVIVGGGREPSQKKY